MEGDCAAQAVLDYGGQETTDCCSSICAEHLTAMYTPVTLVQSYYGAGDGSDEMMM